MPLHAVFDTVTLLQAAATPSGPAGGCLRLVAEGHVTLHMSEDGFAELEDVLGRAKVRKRFPLLTDEGVTAFVHGLRSLADVANAVPIAFRYERDPDDEHILNLAVATKVPFVVTRDKDLLDLMAEGNPAGRALTALHPDLQILDPVSFLASIAPPTPIEDTSSDDSA
ncbi:MAG TPA: putative toxin-antitoxin system toxin component, PIN family [Gemmataceae bacterium]|nr:putative toxin-antitoxin system toxin component, PIN family [Gemmataceae bacterium]